MSLPDRFNTLYVYFSCRYLFSINLVKAHKVKPPWHSIYEVIICGTPKHIKQRKGSLYTIEAYKLLTYIIQPLQNTNSKIII